MDVGAETKGNGARSARMGSTAGRVRAYGLRPDVGPKKPPAGRAWAWKWSGMLRIAPSTQWSPSWVVATAAKRPIMCARSDAGGSVPWLRQTTMGVAQISHSAIQQMSSSWNQGVIRAASHSGQPSNRPASDTGRNGSGADPGTIGPAGTVTCMPTSAHPAGTGYLVTPDSGSGPGVLVLHSWWGLTPFFRRVCDRLADEGFVALAPDLHGEGRTAELPDEAETLLASTDPNVTANIVMASAATLRSWPATLGGPVGILGFSMGASWALWAAARAPDHVAAVSAFYGSQDIDFALATAAFQGHFAEHDEFVEDDTIAEMYAHLRLLGHDVQFHRYPGTGHWFFEDDRPAAFVEQAADLAWTRTVAFLHQRLDIAA